MKKNMLMLFIILVIAKVILTLFINAPSIFSDEYFYFKMGQSFANTGTLAIHGEVTNAYPPLYPLLISLGMRSQNGEINYAVVQIINAVISSLAIIPIFLLAKEFIPKKESLIVAAIVGLLPANFSFTYYILSENLFFPLFLFAIYFMYKGFVEKKYKYHAFAGICVGLSILTRIIGVGLIAIYVIALTGNIIKEKRGKEQAYGLLLFAACCSIVTLPWFLRNMSLFGNSLVGAIGSYENVANTALKSVISFFFWIVAYAGYFIIGSLFVFAPLCLKKVKDKKHSILLILTIAASIVMIGIAAKYGSGGSIKGYLEWLKSRPIGRYVEVVLPLIIITGYINARKFGKEISKKITIGVTLVLSIFSITILFKLFPVNNLSVSWVGFLKYMYDYTIFKNTSFEPVFSWVSVIIFAAMLIGTYLVFKKLATTLKLEKFTTFCLIFLIIINILNFGIIKFGSNRWYENENAQLGIWINNNIHEKSFFVIDDSSCASDNLRDINTLCNTKRDTALISFWLNHEIRIGEVGSFKNTDYILTRGELEGGELIKTTPSGTFLYKV